MSVIIFLDVLGLEEFHLLDMIVKPQEETLEIRVRRQDAFRKCRHCRSTDLAKYGRLTRRLHTLPIADYVVGLVQKMAIKDIAEQLGLSWDVAKDIHKHWFLK